MRWSGGAFVSDIKVPNSTLQALAFSYGILTRDDSSEFQGSLLWMTDWGFWSEEIEELGVNIWKALRAYYGEKRELNEAPGHVLHVNEFQEQHCLFSLPVIFQWDAYLIPEPGDYMLVLSHHGVISLAANTLKRLERLERYWSSWNPKRKQ